MNTLYMNGFICGLGLAIHFSMKWSEHRANIEKVGMITYVREVPAQSAVSILASIGAFTVVNAMGWVNPGMAFACGYMGNSIAENLANKFTKV